MFWRTVIADLRERPVGVGVVLILDPNWIFEWDNELVASVILFRGFYNSNDYENGCIYGGTWTIGVSVRSCTKSFIKIDAWQINRIQSKWQVYQDTQSSNIHYFIFNERLLCSWTTFCTWIKWIRYQRPDSFPSIVHYLSQWDECDEDLMRSKYCIIHLQITSAIVMHILIVMQFEQLEANNTTKELNSQ